jgi:DNA-binding transcriptional MerR regulator
VAFHQEHVERLLFIKRALGYGFGIDEIARLVSPAALLTCGDVYELTAQRAEELRSSESTPPELAALEELMAACDGKGGRRDCSILAKLSECKASG